MKQIYILALCLVTAHAFGKNQKIAEMPYSEENLLKLANSLPRTIKFNNRSLIKKALIFSSNQERYLRALSPKQKEQYYELLQKFLRTHDLSTLNNIALFAQKNRLGTIKCFFISPHGY